MDYRRMAFFTACLLTPLFAHGESCGFQTNDLSPAMVVGRVPVLLRTNGWMPRRPAANPASAAVQRCGTTETYLKKVLGRLLEGSGLQVLAQQEPELGLEFDCSKPFSLPVARASAARILLVMPGLPYFAASEDAIAAVLAHELAHISLRHHERFAKAATSPTRLPAHELRRSHEREADITGLRILVSAGYDPMAAVDHLKAVDALAKKRQLHQFGSRRLHDSADSRARLLLGQIESCRYAPLSQRTPVDLAVKQEIEALNVL